MTTGRRVVPALSAAGLSAFVVLLVARHHGSPAACVLAVGMTAPVAWARRAPAAAATALASFTVVNALSMQ